jgi:hypothetical protein
MPRLAPTLLSMMSIRMMRLTLTAVVSKEGSVQKSIICLSFLFLSVPFHPNCLADCKLVTLIVCSLHLPNVYLSRSFIIPSRTLMF